MSESDTIKINEYPNTLGSLSREISDSGITAGVAILVHSSLCSLGWVSGGAVAVIHGIMDVITPEGTLLCRNIAATCLIRPTGTILQYRKFGGT